MGRLGDRLAFVLALSACQSIASAGCGGPLARWADSFTGPAGTSRLDPVRARAFRAATSDEPTPEAVRQRRALLEEPLSDLTTVEVRALLRSTLLWVESAHRNDRGDAGVVSAIRLTRAALEEDLGDRGALAAGAWTHAMEQLQETEDDCPRDASELGAVAAAARYFGDTAPYGGSLLASELGACRVATLRGAITIERSESEPFVRSCFASGGPPERSCCAVFACPDRGAPGGRAPLTRRWDSVAPDTAQPVVYVELGSSAQAEYFIVVRTSRGWRVSSSGLAWTT